MPADFLIVANPVSGRNAAPQLAQDVLARLRAAGRTAELAVTSAPGDARRLAAEACAAGVPVVVGCGGDGTLHELANALAGTTCALGILPGGRCNDLARALGIFRKDTPADLAAMLLNGPTRKIDLGLCRPKDPAEPPKYFCTVATLGFDSAVTRFVRHHRFPVKGTAEYIHGVLRVMLSFKPPRVTLRGDFGTHTGRVFLVATGNSSSYGGAMLITPNAKVDDGCFEVCVVSEVSRLTLLRILPKVFNGGHVHHQAVKLLQTRHLELEVEGAPQFICADGEELCETPATLEVCPQVLHVKIKST